MQRDLLPGLREAIRVLEEGGYRYAVIGGIAASTWGQSRATHDVDVKVLVPDTDGRVPSLRAPTCAQLPVG